MFGATKGFANHEAVPSAGSPFWRVYAAGFRELQSQVGTGNHHPAKLKSVQAVTVSMQLAAAEEVRRTEKGMAWLGTTRPLVPRLRAFFPGWGGVCRHLRRAGAPRPQPDSRARDTAASDHGTGA